MQTLQKSHSRLESSSLARWSSHGLTWLQGSLGSVVFHVGLSLAVRARAPTDAQGEGGDGRPPAVPALRQLSLAGREFLSSFVLLCTRSLKLTHVQGRRGLSDE